MNLDLCISAKIHIWRLKMSLRNNLGFWNIPSYQNKTSIFNKLFILQKKCIHIITKYTDSIGLAMLLSILNNWFYKIQFWWLIICIIILAQTWVSTPLPWIFVVAWWQKVPTRNPLPPLPRKFSIIFWPTPWSP